MAKAKSSITVKGATLDFESRVDEIAKLVRSFVELKSGFGEDHVKSRTLQNILKQFDIDHTNEITANEFAKALDYMNISCTEDERNALFDRYDANENCTLTFKEFGDAVFGVTAAPCGNPEARSVIKKFKEKMLQRAGDQGVRGMTRTLCLLDKDNSGLLTKEELFNGLQRYGVQCTLGDIDVIVKHFDRDGGGSISLTEFLRGLRGFMPRRRRELVHTAYQILDDNHDETVTLEEIAKRYRTENHPAVLKGEKTAQQVQQEFIQGWDKGKDGRVAWDEFLDYYKDISAGIERDDYFELMMRNCWHISGGTGAAANTSCRRVLCTFKDGHQSIEEIKNDLGIGPKDLDKMRAQLEKQGVKEVVKIEIYA
jgi:Ca2+-binding EF-hand superfamily protein